MLDFLGGCYGHYIFFKLNATWFFSHFTYDPCCLEYDLIAMKARHGDDNVVTYKGVYSAETTQQLLKQLTLKGDLNNVIQSHN